MNTVRTITLSFVIAASLLSGGIVRADDRPPGPPSGPPMMRDHRPYGGYCRGPRWGWYGAQTPVRTEQDARKHLEAYFSEKDLKVGTITDRGRHFLAEILDTKDSVVDVVIINKRTGRIRSLY